MLSLPHFRGLSSNLVKSEKLRSVHLIGMELSEEAWTLFATGVRESVSLEKLTLNRMKFTMAGLDQVAEAIQFNVTLERIDLSCNDLGDEYGTIIAKFVAS